MQEYKVPSMPSQNLYLNSMKTKYFWEKISNFFSPKIKYLTNSKEEEERVTQQEQKKSSFCKKWQALDKYQTKSST